MGLLAPEFIILLSAARGQEILPSVKAIVTVMPKLSVLDPQGAATAEAMKHLGLENIGRVRVGKSIEIELPGGADEAKLHEIARDLLSNPVIEDYTIQINH